jgi:hypothetical protein
MIFMEMIQTFLTQLKQRNILLYINGFLNLGFALLMAILIFFDDQDIKGINAWIKPLKFFLSVAILSWTMGWILSYLNNRKIVKIYTWILLVTMIIELAAICLQSYRGTTSHFNVSTPFNGVVFAIMGIAILTFTVSNAVICFLFFRQRSFNLSEKMIWAYRIGLLCFLLLSIEGGLMISFMKHTVGETDGGPGLPLLNWSLNAGDLRVAHFFGMHALQVIPIVGHYLASSKKQVFIFSALYLTWVIVVFIQALNGIPFL